MATEYQRNVSAQYEALGTFVECFELMVNEAREVCIESICNSIGSGERLGLIEISFHHQVMTAKPLFDIMRAIIAEIVNEEGSRHYADRAVFKDVLTHIANEYNFLYWKRNDLLHGTWFIGYTGENDPTASQFEVRKYKTTKNGLERATKLPKNATELLTLASRCDHGLGLASSVTAYKINCQSPSFLSSTTKSGSFSLLRAAPGPRCRKNSGHHVVTITMSVRAHEHRSSHIQPLGTGSSYFQTC
jgi:hypothetical protein